MKVRRIHVLLVLLALSVCAIPFRATVRRTFRAGPGMMNNQKTIAAVIDTTLVVERFLPSAL